jgi:hypothetical protein
MEPGALDVQILPPAAAEEPGHRQVRHQPDRGDRQQFRGLDLGRGEEPLVGLAEDQGGYDDERRPIDQCDHDPHTVVAEGGLGTGRPRGEPQRKPTEPQGQRIAEDMASIAHEGQAPRDKAADEL